MNVVYSVWAAEGFDEPLSGGEHDLGDLTDEQARSVAGAASAGAVVIVEANEAEDEQLGRHVQSQEDGEKAYAAAVESGDWHVGNLEAFIANARGRLEDPEAVFAEGEREKVASDVALAVAEHAERTSKEKP